MAAAARSRELSERPHLGKRKSMRQSTDNVRASTEGISHEEKGKRKEVLMRFPVAVDNHRRLPRPLDVTPIEHAARRRIGQSA